MGISEEDVSQDIELLAVLKAASTAIEQRTKRSYEYKLYQQTLNGSGTQFLQLRNYPIHSVPLLKVEGIEQGIESFTIESENGMLFKRSGWPRGSRNIEVEYTAGYILPSDETGAEPATLPEDIQLACILYAWIMLRDPVVRSERVGNINVTYADFDADGRLPGPVAALVAPYVGRWV
ncbi:hypothetical protein [Paenibacillus popilliae]|uniref:hypothetical protein n=1 Tax=Paenibacillus popilliae TaxID=78057 RepID=UPI001F3FFF30|nr:hypothetical protein [Paenibacillus popilliae]